MIDLNNNAATVLLETVQRFQKLGYRETSHGVRLYGPAPHIARQAWCHAVSPGLNEVAIVELGREFNLPLPHEYLNFLRKINGAHLFCGELTLYGVRPIAAGRSIDSAFLPFDLIDANKTDRPSMLPSGLIVIGNYRYDGSIIALDFTQGSVGRWNGSGEACLNVWQSFTNFIFDEMTRIDAIFDNQAKCILQRDEDILPAPPRF